MARKKRTSEIEQRKVAFHYLKGPDFRSIHCDGALGGITPRGLLHMAVFSERQAIPKKMVQELSAENALGPEIESERESLDGIVRQMEIDIFMSAETARQIRAWLDDRLKEFEQLTAARRARDSAKEIAVATTSAKSKHR